MRVITTALRCVGFLDAVSAVQAVIAPQVVIVDFFAGEQNAWLGIPEFNLLEQNVTLPGLSMSFPNIHCTADSSVCQLVTGTGEINAAGSALALVLSPAFNLMKTYFLLAGIAGISPEVGTLGAVTFAQFAVQVALQHEFDAREKPDNFSTGYVPLGSTSPGSYPNYIYGTEVFQLNDALRRRAMAFARTATLSDSEDANAYRQLYSNVPGSAAAVAAPSIIGCDTATADTWWSGQVLGRAFENFTKLATNGSATYCTSQQEDNAVLESLLRGHIARRVDFSRVIIMRTGSNFDRPPPGLSAADNLFRGLRGRAPALRNIHLAGIKVVQGILAEWDETYATGVPPQNYVGDIFGSLGGHPSFGSRSVFGGIGAPVQPLQRNEGTTASAATQFLSFWNAIGLKRVDLAFPERLSGPICIAVAFVLGTSVGLFTRVPW